MKRTLIVSLLAILSLGVYAQNESVRLFAHRGGRAEFDENTLQAFNGAYKAGFRGFETDIRMTQDGEFVLLHDSALNVATNGKGNVETTKAKTIKNLRVGKGKVLFLDELLEWIEKKSDIKYFEFELKTDTSLYSQEQIEKMCESLYHKIMAVKPVDATFIITSFDVRPLEFLKSRFTEANLALITAEPVNNTTLMKVKELGLKRLNAKIDGTCREAVDRAHKDGIVVTLWPADDVQDIALGISLGADNVCTDIPAAAKKAFQKAMPWVTIEY